MAFYVRIPGEGGCCPCANQNACDCSGIPCSLECRAKAGTATLCIFPEFVDSGTIPPVMYRRKILSGTMRVKTYSTDPTCTSTCGGSASLSFDGAISGFGAGYGATGSLSVLSSTSTTVTFSAAASATHTHDGVTDSLSARLNLDFSGSVRFLNPGDTITVTKGTEFGVGLEIIIGSFAPQVAATCVIAGEPPEYTDTWNVTSLADLISCLFTPTPGLRGTDGGSQTDTSQRSSDGGSSSIPCANPGACYPGGIDVSQTPTEKRYISKGCVAQAGGGAIKFDGEVDESLDLEDGEDTAIFRVTAFMAWDGPGDCNTRTAFRSLRLAGQYSFAFREVAVRGIVGTPTRPLIVGHLYELKVRYVQRVLGSLGPFTPYGFDTITFVALHPVETTDWLEVPSIRGFETKAVGCSVKDVTAISGPPGSPGFTSPLAVSGAAGVPFSYTLAANNSPTSYAILNTLPSWLNYNATTHTLSGTPPRYPVPTTGIFLVGLSATNGAGTNSEYLSINIPLP